MAANVEVIAAKRKENDDFEEKNDLTIFRQCKIFDRRGLFQGGKMLKLFNLKKGMGLKIVGGN